MHPQSTYLRALRRCRASSRASLTRTSQVIIGKRGQLDMIRGTESLGLASPPVPSALGKTGATVIRMALGLHLPA